MSTINARRAMSGWLGWTVVSYPTHSIDVYQTSKRHNPNDKEWAWSTNLISYKTEWIHAVPYPPLEIFVPPLWRTLWKHSMPRVAASKMESLRPRTLVLTKFWSYIQTKERCACCCYKLWFPQNVQTDFIASVIQVGWNCKISRDPRAQDFSCSSHHTRTSRGKCCSQIGPYDPQH